MSSNDTPDRVLAGHYGLSAEELDFILNYDTCQRSTTSHGGQVKYRLGRDDGEED
jgi:hypothetical protein